MATEPSIIWSPIMSVNDKVIDNQHKKLIQALNDINQVVRLRPNVKEIRKVIEVFTKYSKEHLDYEEKYLTKNNYKSIRMHKNRHQKYRDYFKTFEHQFNRLSKAKSPDMEKILIMVITAESFLAGWWSKHILIEDKQYANWIKENQ
jgi:hemerythrin